MTIVPVAEKMTAEEFLAEPLREDGPRRELIDGEVVVNSPTALHGFVQTNLVGALLIWARSNPSRGCVLVPIDVKVDKHSVFVPDVLWYADGRVPEAHSQPPYAVPDIAVEIRSPSTWRYNLGAKKAAYERKGLPELWLVDTVARTVLVFRRSSAGVAEFDVAAELEHGDELTSPLLPSLTLPIADVFRLP